MTKTEILKKLNELKEKNEIQRREAEVTSPQAAYLHLGAEMGLSEAIRLIHECMCDDRA